MWLMGNVLVYSSGCPTLVGDPLEPLGDEISAKVIAVMLNLFGKARWQRTVPFVDRQVPGRILVALVSLQIIVDMD